MATGALALSVLPWAAVADRIGRARAMTISAVVAALRGLLVPLAPSFEVLLALRGDLRCGARRAAGAWHGAPGGAAPPGRVSAIGGLYIAGTTIGGLAGRVLTGAVGGRAGWRWGLATTAAFVAIAAAMFVGAAGVPGHRPNGASRRRRLARNQRPDSGSPCPTARCGCSTRRRSC